VVERRGLGEADSTEVRGALVIQSATKLDQNLRSFLALCAAPPVKGEGPYHVVQKRA
jgi:hypothetical protein